MLPTTKTYLIQNVSSSKSETPQSGGASAGTACPRLAWCLITQLARPGSFMWAGHRLLGAAGEIKPGSTDTSHLPWFVTIPSDRASPLARVSVGGAPNFYNLPTPLYLKLNAVQLIPDNFLAPSVFPWESQFPCLPSGSTKTLCITQDYLVANQRNLLWLTSAEREFSEGK